MSSIKIKFLLPALFAMAVLVAILQGALGMRSVLELETQAGNIAGRLERSTMIADMDRQFSNVRRLYLMALSASSVAEKKQSLEQLQEARAAWGEALSAFGSVVTEATTKDKLANLQTVSADYDVLGGEFVKLISSSRLYEARAVIAKMVPKGSEAGSLLQEMIDANEAASAADRALAANAADFASVSTILGVTVAAAVALAANARSAALAASLASIISCSSDPASL
ncbi:MAG TPA: MCP four helix bundle domain-containing protein, partial [Pseudorhizobium sp.]|nr:MCP four helix bundle domain-containing protein [Pseudorhizobium sp.]